MTVYANVGHILLKRGNTVQSTAYTGPLGELTYDTDLRTLRVHDGSTVGGNVILINQTTLTAYQTYANANAATQANGINTINANIGSFYTYANANAATQATSIASVNANVTASDSAIGSLRANITAANSAIQALSANIGTLVAGAPGALDTLLELGNALGNSSSFSSTMVVWLGNITSNVTAANSRITTLDANLGTATTNITALFSNAATQATGIDAITANIGGSQTYANTQVNTISANLGAYQTYANGNATTQATSINALNANLGAYQTYGNLTFSTVANAVTQAADITTLYSNAATQATSIDTINANITAANTAIQSLSANIGTLVANAPGALDTLAEIDAALGNNASFSSVMVTWLGNITTNVTTANTSINTINANLGAYQIYANANIGTLYNGNTSTQANLGAYQTYANANAASQSTSIATLQTQVYANANVATYLPTYTGNIAGNIVKNGNVWTFGTNGTTIFPTNISIDYSGGNVQFPRIIADSGKAFSIQAQGNIGSAALAWTVDPDAAGQYAAVAVTKGGGDNLAKVILQAQSDSGDAATAKIWQFNETGTTRFPDGTILAPAGQSVTMQSDNYSQLMWENANVTVAPNMAINSNFYVAQNNATLDIGYRDGSSTQLIKTWLWSVDGGMSFPDTTTQYTAFSNAAVATYLANYDGGINFTASPAVITGLGNISSANFTFANGVNILSTVTDLYANAAVQSANIATLFSNAATQATSINTINNTLTSSNVGIGAGAGSESQGTSAVAVGSGAGSLNQGLYSVAIGNDAGADNQGDRSVAVGIGAGRTNQGDYAVAIGRNAGFTNQGNNSIIINATTGTLNQTTANTFTVAPVRNDVANVAQILFYNTTNKEITYGNTINIAGNINAAQYNFANGVNILSTITAVANLSNLTGNISWTAVGANPPTFTTTSNGTKIVLWPSISSTMVDYAIGIEAGNTWFSIPQAANNFGYKWYAGNTAIATLSGNGTLTTGNITTTGNVNAAQYNFANGVNILSTVGAGAYGNTQVATYLLNFDGDIEFTSSTARIGNVDVITVGDHIRSPAYQFSNGTSILAGITGTYSNANVDAYLPTYTGNITAANISLNGNTGFPSNTSTVQAWARVTIGTTAYWTPLYQ